MKCIIHIHKLRDSRRSVALVPYDKGRKDELSEPDKKKVPMTIKFNVDELYQSNHTYTSYK